MVLQQNRHARFIVLILEIPKKGRGKQACNCFQKLQACSGCHKTEVRREKELK